MAITGIFEADFSKFQTAVEQANVTLRGFQTNSEKVEAGLNRVANSLSGQKVVQQATLMAKAVEDLGGVSKLTAGELERVQAVAQEAVDKFAAMGKTAPDAIQKLANAGKEADEVFTGLGVSMTAVVGAITAVVGVVTLAAAGFAAMLTHSIGLGESIYEMSLKTGASVENLSRLRYVASQTGIDFESLSTSMFKMEKFLGQTGSAADKAQESLGRLGLNITTLKNEKPDQAFIDIVAGLENVKNKSDQAAIGAAIFGRGWKDSAGLASVNIRELMADADKLGLVMSTETAAAAHAADIGFKALGMQLEAVGVRMSNAFLPALIGIGQNLSTIFVDAVTKANKGLDAMGKGDGFMATVAKAMGTGNSAIEAQVKLYDYLRDAIIAVVRYGVEPLVTAGSALMQVWDEGKILVTEAVLGYQKLAYALEQVLLWSLKAEKFANPWDKQVAAEINATQFAMQQLGDKITQNTVDIVNDKQAQQDWAQAGIEANRSIEAELTKLKNTHTDLAGTIKKFADESRHAVGGVSDEYGVEDEKVKKFKKTLEELTKAIDDANNHNASAAEKLQRFGDAAAKAAVEARDLDITVSDGVADMADAFQQAKFDKILEEANKNIREQVTKLNADIKKSYDETAKSIASSEQEMFTLNEKNEADSFDKRLDIINNHFDKERAELNKHVDANAFANEEVRANYFLAMALIDANARKAADEATAAWLDHMQQMARIANTITNTFRNAILGIPQMLTQVFTGGSFSKAIQDFTGKLGSNLLGGMLSAGGALNKAANALGSSFVKMFGDKIGGTLASIIPGIGGAIGALAGPLIGAIGGLFNKLFGHAGRDAVVAFADSLGGFDALQKKLAALGAQGQQLWIALTQGVGKNDPAAAQKAIDAVNAALQTQADKIKSVQDQIDALGGTGVPTMDAITKAAQTLGISTDKLGQSFQDATAAANWQAVIDSIDVLKRSGMDENEIIEDSKDKLNAMYQDALKFGTTLPANAQDWLDKLAEEGQLFDANGNKITKAQVDGMKFGETMQTTLQKLTDALNKLTGTLVGPGGVGDAFKTIGGIVVNPKIKPVYDDSGVPSDYRGGVDVPGAGAGSASYAPSSASSAAALHITVVSQLDGRTVAQNQVRYIPSVLALAGR